MDPRCLLIALNAADVITRAALCRLARDLDAWTGARESDACRLAVRLGVPPVQLRRALALRRRAAAIAEEELARATNAGCHLVTRVDEDYPPALFDLALPPPVLYCRGRLEASPALAVVGARRMDDYGRRVTEKLTRALAASGMVIVSGFARGVDTAAHRAALETAGGRTWAVLGSGLDVDYPRGQERLRREIAERGALITEFPFGSEPRPWHFPIRNRVIAALASAVVVVQAQQRSGSLITAHHALELGRDVWAVPGNIFNELAHGTNELIADGALVVQGPDDLLRGLALVAPRQGELFAGAAAPAPAKAAPARRPPEGLPGQLLTALPDGTERTAEELATDLGQAVDQVLGALLELELGGWVRRQPGPVYSRS